MNLNILKQKEMYGNSDMHGNNQLNINKIPKKILNKYY